MDEEANRMYQGLIKNLRESGRLRNLVVHADWESPNKEKYTYVNLRITKEGKKQEYIQFSENSLGEIIELIWKTRGKFLNTGKSETKRFMYKIN